MARRQPTILSDNQLRQLLNSVDVSTKTGLRNRTAMELMARGGLRVSEICNLERKHVRWETGELEVRGGKGGVDRVVPLDEGSMQWLRLWDGERHGPARQFFHTVKKTTYNRTRHSQLSPRTLQEAVRRYGEEAGLVEIGVTPHVLRHTYATGLLNDGFNLREVQDLLGHASITTTQIYTHVSPVELREKIRRRAAQRPLEQAPDTAWERVREAAEQAGIEPQQMEVFMQAMAGRAEARELLK